MYRREEQTYLRSTPIHSNSLAAHHVATLHGHELQSKAWLSNLKRLEVLAWLSHLPLALLVFTSAQFSGTVNGIRPRRLSGPLQAGDARPNASNFEVFNSLSHSSLAKGKFAVSNKSQPLHRAGPLIPDLSPLTTYTCMSQCWLCGVISPISYYKARTCHKSLGSFVSNAN